MKKISLLLVFVLALVMLLAFSAFAVDKNVAGDADISVNGNEWGSCIPEYWVDGKDDTTSYGPKGWTWFEAYFDYDELKTFTELKVVVGGAVRRHNQWGYDDYDANTFKTTKVTVNFYVEQEDGSFTKVGTTYSANTSGKPSATFADLNVQATRIAIRFDYGGGDYWAPYEVYAVAHESCEYTTRIQGENDRAVTCLADGYETYQCYGCANTQTRTISAPGHVYDNGVETLAPTYEAEGVTTFTCTKCVELGCTDCEGYQYTQPIPMLGHNWDEGTVTPPTCTAKGYTTFTCTDEGCGETKVENYTDVIPHKYTMEVLVKPTVHNEGEAKYTCECGAFYTETLEKLTWGDSTVVIGSENVIGYEKNYTAAEDPRSNPADLFDGIVNKGNSGSNPPYDGWWAPNGSELLITLDKEYYVVSFEFSVWSNYHYPVIQLLNAEKEVIKEQGYGGLSNTEPNNFMTAEKLVNVEGVKYIKVIHNTRSAEGVNCAFQEFRVTVHNCTVAEEDITNIVPATCTTRGSRNETCSVCGLTSVVESAALGHTELTPATCAVAAVCATCGESYGEKLPHTLGTPATCTEKAICSVCEQPYGEFADHVWGEFACSMGNCVNCGAKNEGVSAEPHTYGWKIPVKNEEGEIVKYIHGCSVCLLEAKKDVVDDVEQNYSTNLGFKILYVSNWNELSSNVAAGVEHKVVRFTNDITVASGNNWTKVYEKSLIVDLGGYTITSGNAFGAFYLYCAGSLVNGTIHKNAGGRQALVAHNVDLIEDINIIVSAPKGNNVTAVLVSSYNNISYIGMMRNVTIDSAKDDSGNYIADCGIYNHGIEAVNGASVIGAMENVNIYSKGQAITTTANIGTMTNCKFSGDNVGVVIQSLNGTFKLVNCEIYGGSLAVQIDAAANNEASFVVGSDTTFITNGVIYEVADNVEENNDITLLKTTVAVVNGQLFDNLADALVALKNSTAEITTFALMANLEVAESIVIDKKVNFSLGGGTFYLTKYGYDYKIPVTVEGYTLSCPNDTVGDGIFHVVGGGELTISGGGVINSVGNNNYSIAVWADGGKVIFAEDAGLITNVGAGDEDHYDLVYVKNGGSVVVNGGTFKAQTPKWTLNLNDTNGGTIVVNGGTYYGFNPAEVYSEPNAPVSFISESVKCISIDVDGAYVLASKHVCNHDLNVVTPECTETYTEPTCTEYGYRTHTCICGETRIETFTDNNNKPKGHTWTDATCTSLKTCSVCGATEGEALPHNYVPVENEDGSITYTCQNGCNDSYVINNAAVNGEYYLGTDRVVFNNGVLSAMGGEFTYTYNVTTGKITTDDEGLFFQMIEGTIHYRGRMPLHTHAVDVLTTKVTNPTCTDKGYTTYICTICGPLYDGNYVDATGHSYGSMKIEQPTCTEDGYLQITCRTCEKTFVSPSPETDAYIDSQPPFITITIKPATGHTAAEAVQENVQNATCTAAGSYESVVYCSVCKVELSRTTETITALGHTAGEPVVENNVPATPTTAGSYDKVVYCVTCNTVISRETVTVEPTCKHTNKETIPAVLPLPSNNHTGKTEGLYCLDCETVVKEQVEFTVEKLAADHAFRFRAASIVLDENISVNYKPAKLDGYNNVYVVFVFEGKEYVLDEYLRIEQATSGLRYVFNFDATRPQLMASNIAAYVYAETENGYVMNCKEEYSLLEYCVTQLKGNGKDAYKAIISNALVLGAETQKIMGVNTNALVTDLAIAQGCTLNPTAFTEVRAEQNVQAIVGDRTGGTDWKAGTFRLGSSTEMVLKFETDSIENLRVKITVGGKDTYIDITEETERDGKRYVIVVDFITALQFNEKVVATFERDGKQIGSTAEYSINSYIYKNYNKENNEQEALIKALYVYGQSIYDYSRGTNNYQ